MMKNWETGVGIRKAGSVRHVSFFTHLSRVRIDPYGFKPACNSW